MSITAGRLVLDYCCAIEWATKPGSSGKESIYGFIKRKRATCKSSEQEQATIDFLGADERVQSALHPLPGDGYGAEFSVRSFDSSGTRHHRSDCRGVHSHSGA